MKEVIKGAAITLAVLLSAIALGWMLGANNLAMFKVFAPLAEQIRNDTFKQSASYQDGMIRDLQDMQLEYMKTDPVHKLAIASIIKHRAAAISSAVLPVELNQFIKELP